MKQKLSVAPTLKNYDKKNFPKDILAGIIIMAVSIPISMGYAQISGLPAVYGLYGSVFPIILFALFSTSPQFIFGVDAATARYHELGDSIKVSEKRLAEIAVQIGRAHV